MIYAVPTTRAKDYIESEPNFIAASESEAVALACGHYLATGSTAKVVIGDNGLLNALDAILSLAKLHEIPIQLVIFPRADEPQHAIVTAGLQAILETYKIEAEIL